MGTGEKQAVGAEDHHRPTLGATEAPMDRNSVNKLVFCTPGFVTTTQAGSLRKDALGLPWCPVAKTPHSRCRRSRFDPQLGN